MTVSEPSKPERSGVAVTVWLVSAPTAFALQISDVPACVLLRLTSVHASPAPVTVALCAAAALGPSRATKASTASPAVGVLSAGDASVPLACLTTSRSIASVAEGGALLSTVTVTPADVPVLPAASEASAVTVWDPALAVRVSHEAWKGGVVTGAPTAWPSTLNCTRVTPTLSEAVAPSATMPLIVVAALGSVTVTCGAVASGGGGDCDPGSTSMAARLHWWLVGAVSSLATTVPAGGVGEVWECAQEVWR